MEQNNSLLYSSKEALKCFLVYHQEYIKELHQQKRRIGTLDADNQQLLTGELDDMEEQLEVLQNKIEKNQETVAGY